MDDLVPRDVREAARRLRGLIAAREAGRDLVMMGAYRAGGDPLLDEALALSKPIDAFLTQTRGEAVGLAQSHAGLIELMAANHA